MAEYIEREALKEKFWGACKNCLSEDDIADLIDDVPAANVAPVVHGRWELDHADAEDSSFDVVRCSTCGYKAYAISVHIRNGNYCPVCGAKMDGGEKPND